MKHGKFLLAFAILASFSATGAEAQLLKKLLDRVKSSAQNEVERKIDRETRHVTRCVLGDEQCIQNAQRSGATVEVVPATQSTNAPSGRPSQAGGVEPLVHLALNNTLENEGSAGHTQLFAPYGATRPAFVAGKRSMALQFENGGAVTIPFEFDQQANPRATVTMWLRVDEKGKADRDLFSIGHGSGLRVQLTKAGSINVRSGSEVTHPRPVPLGEWVFVSAVVDTSMGFARIQQNDDAHLEPFRESRAIATVPAKVPGGPVTRHHIFIGAEDFNGAISATRPVILDDVRLYAAALSADQIETIRQSAR